MKLALTQAPVLGRPDFSKPFTLQTDASDYAIGAVLTQESGFGADEEQITSRVGAEKAICYATRVLTPAERNYTVTERECLAVLWAMEKFRPYIEGTQFTVITDHASLRWLKNIDNPTGRLARWAMRMAVHSFKIVHRRGSLHAVPDALSRLAEGQEVLAVELEEDSDEWFKLKKANVAEYPGKYPDWCIDDGRLYYHHPSPLIDPTIPDLNEWKLVIPLKSRMEVLEQAHSPPQAGHMGTEKTFQRIAKDFYWPGFYQDVKNFVRSCRTCQMFKASQLGPSGLMRERTVSGPWSMVSADIMGVLTKSNEQKSYLLVFQDYFTKYVELRALRKADAKSVWKAFDELILNRWGKPHYFLTDNGTEFTGQELVKKLEECGIRHVTTPPYHPQSNPTERVNRTLKPMLGMYISSHRDWDKHLHELAFAINTATQSSTKFSPAFLNMARHPRPIVNLKDSAENNLVMKPGNHAEWANRMGRMALLHDLVQKHLGEAYMTQAKAYNKGRVDRRFKVGDLVLKKNRRLSKASDNYSSKFAPRFVGPFRITRVISPVMYELETLAGVALTPVHINELRAYVDRVSRDDGVELNRAQDADRGRVAETAEDERGPERPSDGEGQEGPAVPQDTIPSDRVVPDGSKPAPPSPKVSGVRTGVPVNTDAEQTRRPRGRPRKTPRGSDEPQVRPVVCSPPSTSEARTGNTSEKQGRRPRGRPRKNPEGDGKPRTRAVICPPSPLDSRGPAGRTRSKRSLGHG